MRTLLYHALAIHSIHLIPFSVIERIVLIFLLSYLICVIFKFVLALVPLVFKINDDLLVRADLHDSYVFTELMPDLLELLLILHDFWCDLLERPIDQ